MRERLQKVLSAMGVASRRRAEAMIGAREVQVNGQVATLGQLVDPDLDHIVVRGAHVGRASTRTYCALNKPINYVTTLHATHGEQVVMELLPAYLGLYPAGRLDKDTSGLLLFTNDGTWANFVTHPRYQIDKEYVVQIRNVPAEDALRQLRLGITLPDGSTTAPARVEIIEKSVGGSVLSFTVREGKKRQIRLMAQAVGCPVVRLERIRIGPIALDGLPSGEWRHLEKTEVEALAANATQHLREATRGTGDSDRG